MRNTTNQLMKQRGDTIVEVMIVLAILGSAIGISFATAAHSLIQIKSTEQNSTAANLVQEQLEILRSTAYAHTGSTISPVFTQGDASFCLDTSGAIYTDPNPNEYSSLGYASQCQATTSPGGPYYLAITYQPIGNQATNPTVGTFTITAFWDDLAGEGEDSSTLTYRVY